MMIGLLSITTDPAFNLATEEYLLKHRKDNIFYLYSNEPSIITGKHQNTLAEIDYNYILKHHIPVFRRLSGGGTVYHDPGNLNFCFITNEEKGNLVNFEKHAIPIVKALERSGLKIEVGERHDLSINHEKISGNASHVFKNRSMHHGTLLFSSDLSVLNKCLNADPEKYTDKAVKSVRSKVTNISDHLDEPMSFDEFKNYIFNFLMEWFPDAEKYKLSDDEKKFIEKLKKEKYDTWEWNYGYSPFYELKKTTAFENLKIISEIKVEKGLIKSASFKSSDPAHQKILDELGNMLKGIQHNKTTIQNFLEKQNINFDIRKLTDAFF